MIDRKDVDINQTWDLSLLFKSEEDYEKSLDKVVEDVDNFVAKYESKINNEEDIKNCLEDYREIIKDLNLIGTYCSLDVEANVCSNVIYIRLFCFNY